MQLRLRRRRLRVVYVDDDDVYEDYDLVDGDEDALVNGIQLPNWQLPREKAPVYEAITDDFQTRHVSRPGWQYIEWGPRSADGYAS